MTETEKPQWRQVLDDTAELLPCIVCEVDPNLRLIWVNQLGLDTFQFTIDEYQKGIDLTQIFETDDGERALGNFHKVFDSPSLPGPAAEPNEYRLLKRDGTIGDYQIRFSRIQRNEQIIGVRVCLWDVTEKKLAAQKLRESEERFRRIFFQSPAGIALFLNDGTFIEENMAFKKILDDLHKKNDVSHPHCRTNLFELLSMKSETRKQLRQGAIIKATATQINIASQPNKSTHYLDWVVTPLQSDGEVDAMLLLALQDVTARTLAEKSKLDAAQQKANSAILHAKNLEAEMRKSHTFNHMIAASEPMQKIFQLLPPMAQTNTTVLVQGQSGTGKELIAKALHDFGPRSKKPFIPINCGALPDTLLEAELFGYKAGAFTDAKKDKPGKFLLANEGIIFLDEIGDISPAMQVKLLRVLQERCFDPLGATSSIQTDVKVIAATNKDLSKMVQEGLFRQDLFYRINVLKIQLPALKERLSDIPLLCDHFIEKFNTRFHRNITSIDQDALNALLNHNFPGNIRELENIIEHAFIFCKQNNLSLAHLPEEIVVNAKTRAVKNINNVSNFDEVEANFIRSVLEEVNNNKAEAARRMGIHKATLFRKIKKFNL